MSEIMIIKQLPLIEEKFQQLETVIKEKTSHALSLDFSDENIKEIKKVRADLNKDFKLYEEERKKIKNAILKPYEDFNAKYKECVESNYKHAETTLKQAINSIEDKKKELILQVAKEYYETCKIDNFDFESLGIKVSLSHNEMKIIKEVDERVKKIESDLSIIEALENSQEIKCEYIKNQDLSKSVEIVKQRKVELEKLTKVETEDLNDLDFLDDIHFPFMNEEVEEVEEVKSKTTLIVNCTNEQLNELKTFMFKNHIEFEEMKPF